MEAAAASGSRRPAWLPGWRRSPCSRSRSGCSRLLDAPGPGRAARAAGRGARGRADRAAAGRDRADACATTAPTPCASPRSRSTTRSRSSRGADEPIGRLETATVQIDASRGSRARPTRSRCSPSTGGDDRRTRSRSRSRRPDADLGFFGLMALLGHLRRRDPDRARDALAAVAAAASRRAGCGSLIALTVGLLAFLAIDATLEGLELAGEGSQAFGGAALVFVGAAGAPTCSLAGVVVVAAEPGDGAARRAGLSSRCSSRSASGCTTSARASRSAPPTPPARSRWARSWSSASRSTTPPRAWRSSRRRARAADACRPARAARPDRRRARRCSAPGSAPRPSTEPSRRSCSASAPARSSR